MTSLNFLCASDLNPKLLRWSFDTVPMRICLGPKVLAMGSDGVPKYRDEILIKCPCCFGKAAILLPGCSRVVAHRFNVFPPGFRRRSDDIPIWFGSCSPGFLIWLGMFFDAVEMVF